MRNRVPKPLIFIIVAALAALVVMLLWNSIIPSVIGWGSLSYLQSLGLLALCKLLFGRLQLGLLNHRRDIKELLKDMSREQKREYIREYISKGRDEKE